MEVRLSRLEELLRQLTGRIEEAEFAQRQATTRLDRLVADLDGRPGVPGPRAAIPAAAADRGGGRAPSAAATHRAAFDHRSRRRGAARPRPGNDPRGRVARQPRSRPRPCRRPAAGARPAGAAGAGRCGRRLQGRAGSASDRQLAGCRAVVHLLRQGLSGRPRAPTASYWLGETYFFRKEYPTAASVFARNYRTYGQDAPRAPTTC